MATEMNGILGRESWSGRKHIRACQADGKSRGRTSIYKNCGRKLMISRFCVSVFNSKQVSLSYILTLHNKLRTAVEIPKLSGFGGFPITTPTVLKALVNTKQNNNKI